MSGKARHAMGRYGLVWGLAFLAQSCSSGDTEKPQEPVVPPAETTPYPEDPALAQNDSTKAAAPSAEPAAGSADGDAAKAAEPPKAEDGQAVGDLTNDPFKGAHAATETDLGTAAAPESSAPNVDEGAQAAVQGAFQDNAPTYEAKPGELPPEEASTGRGAHHKGKHAKSHGKGVRYVTAKLLNVHSKPSLKAKVVTQIKGGTQVHVLDSKNGWSKIKAGQWVRAHYLGTKAP